VIVSHDRFFLDNLVSRVVEIVDGGAILYPGNYSWFIEKRRERSSESAPQGSARDAAGTPQASDGCRSRRRAEAERRNELYRRKKVVLDIMNPLEARIELLEREQSARDALLGDPAFLADSSKVSALLIERDRAARLITELLEEWEDLADEVARIEETG